jgi:hypothetical protein
VRRGEEEKEKEPGRGRDGETGAKKPSRERGGNHKTRSLTWQTSFVAPLPLLAPLQISSLFLRFCGTAYRLSSHWAPDVFRVCIITSRSEEKISLIKTV